ncbi:MAG: hypothetical protein LQ342_004272 [Letrouitia transgressa]|nr:MAG: hypothetical protein LQ342_004272 [Letrouitia transgressa]
MRNPRSPASNLFVDYVFESPFVVPFRALGRKHWFVSAVSLTFLLISLIFPASQGALLGIERVSYSVPTESFQINRHNTGSANLQQGEFVDQARAISVPDGAKLPPWTTTSYSANLFRLENRPLSRNETWTVETPVLYADPHCRKMEIETTTVASNGFDASSFQGSSELSLVRQTFVFGNFTISEPPFCNLSISFVIGSSLFNDKLSDSQNRSFFPIFSFNGFDFGRTTLGVNAVAVGLPTSGSYIDTAIQSNPDFSGLVGGNASVTCPSQPRIAGILALDLGRTAVKPDNGSNITPDVDLRLAIYACDRRYYWALGNVTVNAEDETILSVEQTVGQQLLTETQFSDAAFESFLDSGTFPGTNFSALNASQPVLRAISYRESLASVVLNNLTFGPETSVASNSLLENDVLGHGFESGYKLIFALATGAWLRLPTPTESVEGFIHIDTFAIVVNPIFAIMSETLLALSTLILLVLAFGYYRRSSILRSDPDSITAQCCIIADELQGLGDMELISPYLDQLSTKSLRREIDPSTLEYSERSGQLRFIASSNPSHRRNCTGPIPNQKNSTGDPLPFFMTKLGITLAVIAITSIMTVLLFLVIWASHVRGFAYLTNSTSFRSQLLWSFVPAIIATCLEANFISLHRDLSVLESWVRIRKGNKLAKESLSQCYASKPPSLVLFLSLKRKHLVLSLVSFLCITTSVLNISMAGLFLYSFDDFVFQGNTVSEHTTSTLRSGWFQDEFNIDQAFSALRAELSDNATLPSWTTHDQSLMPVDFTALDPAFSLSSKDNFNTTTAGIASSLNCVAVPDQVALNSSGPGVFTDEQGARSIRYKSTIPNTDKEVTCSAPSGYNSTFQSLFFVPMDDVSASNGSDATLFSCTTFSLIVSVDVPTATNTFHICTPEVKLSNFNIIHDKEGNVFSSQASNHDLPASPMLKNQSELLTKYTTSFIFQAGLSKSEITIIDAVQASTCYDWPGLLMTRLRSTLSTTSIPELADSMWRRVFANWFSTYRDQLLTRRQEGDPSFTSTTGTATYREARMIPSIPAFALSVSLLTLYLVAFVFIVARRRHRYVGPRMPKTIGSIIPWVMHSRMLEDFEGMHYMCNRDRDEALARIGGRYGFGRFRARDGRVRLGIEYEELLMAEGAYGDF